MKKLFAFILILLILPTILALEVQIKEKYDRGETMIAKVSGIIDSTISPDNIYFYKGKVRIPILYDVAKLQNEVYIYAILPESPDNYTLKIKDVTYRDGTKVITSNIERNFSVSDKLAAFNINPGYIITNNNFSIKVQNLQSLFINIKSESVFSSEDIPGEVGEERTVYFNIPPGLNATTYYIKLSSQDTSYSIPVLLTKSTTTTTFEKKSFRFSPSILSLSLINGQNNTFIAYLYNTGQKNITDISVFTEDSKGLVILDTKNISNLPSGENQKIKMFIYPNQTGIFRVKIIASTDDIQTTFPLTFTVYSEESQLPKNDSQQNRQDYYTEDRTCRNINGLFCAPNQKCICNESLIKGGKCQEQFLEGTCCLGSCQLIPQEENPTTTKSSALGWFIVLILLVGVFWFLKKNFSKG